MIFHTAATALRSLPLAGALLALLTTASQLTAQTTVTVPCLLDNTLYESPTGTLSNGAGSYLFVGVTGQPGLRRAVMKFNVAGVVPAGARILSAQLTINVVQSRFAGNLDVTMHRVLQAWGEGISAAAGGGGAGAPATAGDATWLHTFYSSALWTTPGGDFVATPSATIVTPSFGACSSALSNALIADVQSMLDTPAQNHGWLLKTDEVMASTSRKISSRQAATGRPSLSVTYLLPGQAAALGQGCLVNGQPFTLSVVGNPIGGTTVQMVQGNGPQGQLSAHLIGLVYDPTGTPLPPGCSLYLPLGGVIATQSLVFLSAQGTASTNLAIPVGYPGVSLVLQAAAIDSNPAGYVLSNAVMALLQ